MTEFLTGPSYRNTPATLTKCGEETSKSGAEPEFYIIIEDWTGIVQLWCSFALLLPVARRRPRPGRLSAHARLTPTLADFQHRHPRLWAFSSFVHVAKANVEILGM